MIDMRPVYPHHSHYRRPGIPWYFAKTGEKRPPRKGEWYLSGAIPEAWEAMADLDTEYIILEPVPHQCVNGHPFLLADLYKGQRVVGKRLLQQCDCPKGATA